jgi:hypothetical protein
MKTDSHNLLMLAPTPDRSVLEEIRNDRELLARLKITPQELDALSKLALLGTLSGKEDMLFILRLIREATGPSSSGQMAVLPLPAAYSGDEEQEDTLPDFRQIQSRFAADMTSEPGSLKGPVRPRLPGQIGVVLLAGIMAVALFRNGIITMSRWHDSFVTRVGMSVSRGPASEVWFNRLDRFSVLLSWEALSVAGIIGAIYFRSLRGRGRLKVRPRWRY